MEEINDVAAAVAAEVEEVEAPEAGVEEVEAPEAEVEEVEAPAAEVEEVEETPDAEAPDVERLIAEAEQRGYLRGCNEQIEQLMARPGLWQAETDVTADGVEDEPEIMILNRIRPSIWDK